MGSPRKIILAEDNLADAQLTRIAFDELDVNLEVVHVVDGQKLLDYLKSSSHEEIALILLDLNMPRMGGLEVLKVMYEDEELRNLPVVVLSSSAHESDVKTCYEYGANAYVRKPIDMEEFHKSIRSIAYFWGEVNVLPVFVNI
ncbi:MAG: response regulator [Bacteroidota bacterium]